MDSSMSAISSFNRMFFGSDFEKSGPELKKSCNYVKVNFTFEVELQATK